MHPVLGLCYKVDILEDSRSTVEQSLREQYVRKAGARGSAGETIAMAVRAPDAPPVDSTAGDKSGGSSLKKALADQKALEKALVSQRAATKREYSKLISKLSPLLAQFEILGRDENYGLCPVQHRKGFEKYQSELRELHAEAKDKIGSKAPMPLSISLEKLGGLAKEAQSKLDLIKSLVTAFEKHR